MKREQELEREKQEKKARELQKLEVCYYPSFANTLTV